jgi:hypothetical protein
MGVTAVLAEGWRLFAAGLMRTFPWVLAAELLGELPAVILPADTLSTDRLQSSIAEYVIITLICGCIQALLYGIAVVQLARLADESTGGKFATALRGLPGVFIGYLLYVLMIIVGLVLALAFLVPTILLSGIWLALVMVLIPLIPTAFVSTLFAFFVYPAVLEGRGPFAALGRSAELARSGWAQATVVISVPALALMFAWSVGNGVSLIHTVTAIWTTLMNISPDTSVEQLQSLLAADNQAKDAGFSGWQLAGTLLGAFAWWYTLAVCYVEYRELKARAAARVH